MPAQQDPEPWAATLSWSFAAGWTLEHPGGAEPLVELEPAERAAAAEALRFDWAGHGEAEPLDLAVVFRATGGPSEAQRQALEAAVEALAAVAATACGDLRLRGLAVGDHPQAHIAPAFVTSAQPAWVTDPAALRAFVAERLAAPVDGIDPEEAYECALREARALAWRPSARRALVVLADVPPHTPADTPFRCGVDWRAEAARLREDGVVLLPVHVALGPTRPLIRRRTLEFLEALAAGAVPVATLGGPRPPDDLLAAVQRLASARRLDIGARRVLERVAVSLG